MLCGSLDWVGWMYGRVSGSGCQEGGRVVWGEGLGGKGGGCAFWRGGEGAGGADSGGREAGMRMGGLGRGRAQQQVEELLFDGGLGSRRRG